MTTHVFIVDVNTFRYHLEYLFAGTGAKDCYIDFNGQETSSLKYAAENNLVGMMADSLRVRKGDFVLFYLQQNYKEGVYEGKFFGIFKIKEDLSFLDNNDTGQYLKDRLIKSLVFRTLIEPYEVYPMGVSEWEALDEIKQIQSPNQMLWSLIYRKLKGNRGNTMITIYESERLFKLIREKNRENNNCNQLSGTNFTFDFNKKEIKKDSSFYVYSGRKEKINILPRLINKYTNNKAFEMHLQAYIIQNIGRNENKSLDECILDGLNLEWIGNEVSCGVGMQRIDIMLSLIKNSTTKLIIPIELKAVEANENNVIQIQRYVDWIEQYYIPNRISDIQPILISKKINNKNLKLYQDTVLSFSDFNRRNSKKCLPIKYIEYEINGKNLQFQKITYQNS